MSEFSHKEPAPYFVGEMIFPQMFEEIEHLRPFRNIATALADDNSWGPLYDIETLRANKVPVVGTIYVDDLYVNFNYAMETACAIGNCWPWITNEYEHGAYWFDHPRVFERLFNMLDEHK